ncbi:hypothetical protein [Photobacterium leiognathi]|uniref:hypothetical protein n=1 Tax=Photobacterium leiognathi TaxID=553611 RepID=UPI00298153D5|nr:hypothetical protein [Photobacterium leiognathi]
MLAFDCAPCSPVFLPKSGDDIGIIDRGVTLINGMSGVIVSARKNIVGDVFFDVSCGSSKTLVDVPIQSIKNNPKDYIEQEIFDIFPGAVVKYPEREQCYVVTGVRYSRSKQSELFLESVSQFDLINDCNNAENWFCDWCSPDGLVVIGKIPLTALEINRIKTLEDAIEALEEGAIVIDVCTGFTGRVSGELVVEWGHCSISVTGKTMTGSCEKNFLRERLIRS